MNKFRIFEGIVLLKIFIQIINILHIAKIKFLENLHTYHCNFIYVRLSLSLSSFRLPPMMLTSARPRLESCRQKNPFLHRSQTLVHVGQILVIWIGLSVGGDGEANKRPSLLSTNGGEIPLLNIDCVKC